MKRGMIMCFIMLISGCGPEQPPAGILDQEQFARVYAELVENERTISNWTTYNIRKYHPDSTLAKAGVTREEMIATMEYYNENPERWQEFYLEAVRRLEGANVNQPLP